MSDHITQKIQKIVDLLGDCAPPAPPPAKPVAPHIQHGGTVLNIHPGAHVVFFNQEKVK